MLTSYQFVRTWLQAHAKSERGASLVEYALLVALIAVACIAALNFLSGSSSDKLNEVGSSIAGVTTTSSGG